MISLVTAACGSVAPVGPSPTSSTPSPSPSPSPAPNPAPAPAQQFPSLVGDYRTSGSNVSYRNRETGVVTSGFSCSGSASVKSQTGGDFSGGTSMSGNGWNSDRFCTYSGSFTGVMTADGAITRATIEPRFGGHLCTFVSGDGIFTGNATATTVRMQTTDRWRCPVNLDGGLPGNPTAEFDRTVTLSFERR